MSHVDSFGIPLDGPDERINSIWRQGKLAGGGLEHAVAAIKLLTNAGKAVTVRTMVHARNVAYVAKIPELLEAEGIDLSMLRWKMYPFNPHTGDRAASNLQAEAVQFIPAAIHARAYMERFIRMDIIDLNARDRLLISPTGEASYPVAGAPDQKLGNIHKYFGSVVLGINAGHQELLDRTNHTQIVLE